MNCIVIEDNLEQQELINSHINKTSSLRLLGSFLNFSSAIDKMNSSKVDVIFLDIEISEGSGLEFLDKYELDEDTQVVLTTKSTEFS